MVKKQKRTYKKMNQINFNTVKSLASQKNQRGIRLLTDSQIAGITGYSLSTVNRVVNTANFEEYLALANNRLQESKTVKSFPYREEINLPGSFKTPTQETEQPSVTNKKPVGVSADSNNSVLAILGQMVDILDRMEAFQERVFVLVEKSTDSSKKRKLF